MTGKYYNNGWFGRHPAIYLTFVESVLRPLRKQAIKCLDLESPNQILDVATGTGGQAFEFNKNGHSVLGIDLDIEMLRKAQLKQIENQEIPFIHADGTKLPLKTSSFDIVTISYAMHDVPRSIGITILEEANRVIKDTGMICVIDFEEPTDNIAARILYHIALIYESPNFKPFIQEGFSEYLKHAKLKVVRKDHIALGAVRLLCLQKA